MPTQQPQSGLEFVSELSDLTIGAGMLIFTLAPFSLPVLVLTALAAVALVIPAFVGLVVAASFLLVRRWWRSRDRLSGGIKPSRCGDGKPRTRRRRSAGALGGPVVPYPAGRHRLNSEASRVAARVS
jgi:hypothetical protein